MTTDGDAESLAAENRRDALAALISEALAATSPWHTGIARDADDLQHVTIHGDVNPTLLAEAILVAGWQLPGPIPFNAAEVMGYTDWEAEAHRNDPTAVTDEAAEQAWYLAVSAGRPEPQPGDPIPDMRGGFHEHTWTCRMCGTPREDDQ